MTSQLDSATHTGQHDPSGSLDFAFQQPDQLRYDFGLVAHQFNRPVANVVVAGMGGSALAAELATTWPAISVPFVIAKDYDLPAFVSEDTLVICSSYSGNTEETLSALTQAEAKGAQIAVAAHGGKLGDRAKEMGYAFAELPEAPQPRMGVFYGYRALCELLVAAGVAPEDTITELEATSDRLAAAVEAWRPDVEAGKNEAKQIAEAVQGKTPVVYAGAKMYPAAYKWKISANENAKNTAWSNFFPELNHNEFIGWSLRPADKPFACIDLTSSFEHERTQRRFEVTEQLLEGKKPAAITVEAKGDTAVEHMLYLVLLGDVTTLYLALLNQVDPTPVALVEDFKKALG